MLPNHMICMCDKNICEAVPVPELHHMRRNITYVIWWSLCANITSTVTLVGQS